MEIWKGRARDGTRHTVVGNPSDHPDFNAWAKASGRREAGVLIGDELIWLRRVLVATQDDSIPCTHGCKKAQTRVCRCSCGGKNHGIDNRDGPHAIQEEDVIWIGPS